MNSATGTKSKNIFSQHQDQSISTTIYSYNELDELLGAQNQKYNPRISESSSGTFQQQDDQDLSKVSRILSRMKNQQHINQLLSILENTQVMTVQNQINDFFLRIFLQQSERNLLSIQFETILLEFHRFFPFFNEENQIELLDALSSLHYQVSPKGTEKGEKNSNSSDFQIYKSTVNCCTLVLQQCIKTDFTIKLTLTFIKSILQNTIKIASNVSQTTTKLIKKADYVCEVLPFVSEIEELMTSTNDQDLIRLIQQYFITCILFTLDDFDYIKKWNSSLDKIAPFIPPLIQRKPKIDFSSTKVRIEELLSFYDIQKYKKVEDVISIFSKILPGLPTKYLYQMSFADVVYSLSIYYLEKMKAERGIFGQILEYIEVKYIPHFSGILKAMIDPLLNTFYDYLKNLEDVERKEMCASFTICELIQQFASSNERVQLRVDPILKDFANNYPILICNTDVLNSIADTYNELIINGNQQRIQIFSEITNKLFEEGFSQVPNLFDAAIFHSQLKRFGPIQILSNSSSSSSASLFPILQNLSPEKNENIMKSIMLRSVVSGQAKFADEDLIRRIENEQERFLLSASYLCMNPDSDIVFDLLKYNEPHILLLAWTQIAMNSVEMSKLIVPLLIQTFVDLSKNNAGIFGLKKTNAKKIQNSKENTQLESKAKNDNSNSKSKSDDDDSQTKSDDDDSQTKSEEEEEGKSDEKSDEKSDKKSQKREIEDDDFDENLNDDMFVIDDKYIQYQTTLLQFLIENITLGRHSADYASVLMCALDKTFVSHASIVPAVISYAYLGCLIMKIPFMLSSRYYDYIRKIILKLSLIAYSFAYDDYVLKYITERELFLLQQLILCLPDVFNLSNKYNETNKDKTQNSDSTFQTVEKNYLQEKEITINFTESVKIVSFLLCDEVQIFNAFLNQTQTSASLQKALSNQQSKESELSNSKRIKEIWDITPEALYPFCKIPRIGQSILSIISKLMKNDHFTAPSVPMLAPLYSLSPKSNLNYLKIWKTIPGNKALSLLTPELMKNKISASYVAHCFQKFTKRESLLFLPQLVQSLRFDKSEVLRHFLISYCKKSEVFSHYLLWNILAEKNNPIGNKDNLPGILKKLEKTIIDNMNEKEKKDYENEFGLIDKLDQVSQKLLPMEIEQRPPAFVDMLNELEIPEGLYIPSNPNYKILSINSDQSVPLKSHARVPILVHFNVYDENDENKTPIPFSCIFKIHDDVRQDAMMIQFIDMTKQILTDAGIDHYLFPYRVFATGENRGVIECIHHAKSRHEIGVATNEYLLTYFINKYGKVGTPGFQRAQDNFIKSVAPYSLICYLFQVKDRHNANIMIDDDGHMLHIDFGFIFEISPGGNMKFERSPFKLTKEMVDVLGGSKDALPFQKFVKLLTQCFFAVRARHEEIEAITSLMMNAGFPCFLPDSIKKLRARLFIDKSAKETCTEIVKLVDSAFEAKSTTFYDTFQKMQNGIWY